MKKIFAAMTIMAVAMVGVVISPAKSEAIPNFARQMNLPCFACHFQNVPKLNAFGRSFKMGGFTDAAIDLIEDDGLSVPATAPIGFVWKLRYQTSTPRDSSGEKSGTDRGEWQMPDEAAIWLGGRGGENIGYAVEWGGPALSGKAVFSAAIGGGRAGLVAYWTDGLGPSFGFEVFNTGVLRSNRMFENRSESNAFHATGVAGGVGGAAQGLTAYYGSGIVVASVGLWAPVVEHADGAFDLSTTYRLAVTPSVAGWDTMIGLVGSAGKTKCVECGEVGANADETLQEFSTEYMAVDFQAQGELAGMNTEITGAYVTVPDTAGNIWGEGNAFHINAEFSINPTINIALGYMSQTDKSGAADVDNSGFTVAPIINLAQNQNLRLEYSSLSGDGRPRDSMITVMLFGGF
jgi:hypothetical protein